MIPYIDMQLNVWGAGRCGRSAGRWGIRLCRRCFGRRGVAGRTRAVSRSVSMSMSAMRIWL